MAINNNEQILFRKSRDCGIDDETGEEYAQLIALNPNYPAIDSWFVTFEVFGVANEHWIKLE